LPVRKMADESATFVVWAPVERSSVPLAGALQVFSTQLVRAATGFGISSGVPKLHPVVLQSGTAELGGGAVVNAPMVQSVPVQLSVTRLVAPSGVGASWKIEPPPPTLRPPQVRVLISVPLALRVSPQTPPGAPVVNSRNAPSGGAVVVVVLLVVVLVVEVVVVVVIGVHIGTVGSVQEQIGGTILHWAITDLLHALRSVPDKPAHPASISSAQVFLVHTFCALATEGTKTPAPSATAANVTTALLIIVLVEPPYGRSRVHSDFGALLALRARLRHACQRLFWTNLNETKNQAARRRS
jgi:hypothetical protein